MSKYSKSRTMRVKLVDERDLLTDCGDSASMPVWTPFEQGCFSKRDPWIHFVWVFQVYEDGEWRTVCYADGDLKCKATGKLED